MKKRLRPYIDYLQGAGLEVVNIANTKAHLKVLVTSEGNRRFFIVSATPSDRRSFENWKSDVRRWVKEVQSDRVKS